MTPPGGPLDGLQLPDPPWIVAHRGSSADQPENSLPSAHAAIEGRAHMIEVDVRATRDGTLVLVHDATVTVAGGSLPIERSETAELFAAFDEATRPTTLAELLESLPETASLNLDLKRDRADPTWLAERLLEVVSDRERLLVSSFDHDLLAILRRARPDLPLAPIGDRRPHDLLRAAERLGAAAIHCHRRLAFDDFIGAARAGGWPVLTYTINDPTLATALFERGVSGVFTDRPGALRGELGLDL